MPRTCFCNDVDGCSRCRVYETHPAYAPWALLPRDRVVPCRHRGAGTRFLACVPGAGEAAVKAFACARHGECTAAQPAPGVACCSACPDYQARSLLQIEVTAFGIGDHILALTSAAGLRHDHPESEIVLACKPWNRPWAELFSDARCVDAPLPGVPSYKPHDSYENQITTRLARPRWEHYAEACRTTARPPTPRPLPRNTVAWARPYAGRIALIPFSSFGIRTWDLGSWLRLESLLLERGFTCGVLDDRPGRTNAFRSDKVLAQSAPRVAAVLHAAECAVANDSGMAHLAGALGTPTVVVCGSWPGEKIYGIYPDVRTVNGPWPCSGCCENPQVKESVGCRDQCFSLQAVSPREVLGAVERAVCRPALEHTLLRPEKRAMLRRCVRETAGLPGVMAEVGVSRGGSALLMADSAPGKTLHLFDTFRGLPADCSEGRHRAGEFAADEAAVRRLLAGSPVRFHVGRFPDTTAGLEGERYSCVHIDADLYESTRDAIAYFWPRMVPGGRLLFDDWEWSDTPGVSRAIREAFQAEQIEETAAHQCQVRKTTDPEGEIREPFLADEACERELQHHLDRLCVPVPTKNPMPMSVADRRPTMRLFLRAIVGKPNPLVVETGCQRSEQNYAEGMSTTLFGLLLRTHGGRLISLDNSPAHVEFARSRAATLPVEILLTDSRDWLGSYSGPPIDALYLDSQDTWEPGYQVCCLEEAQLAARCLSPVAAILIDDTWPVAADQWDGKGAKAVPWLLSRGWRVRCEAYQVLLSRESRP